MKSFRCFRWLVAAAVAATLPVTARVVTGHSMGGFVGGGPHVSGGQRGMAPHISAGRVGMAPHMFRGHRFVDHDRFFDHHRFVDHDRFFFRHNDRFFFAFDFVSFGFPWWYPYPYYYRYPYDYSSYDYGPAYDSQYWNKLAVSVQSELARRGYYQGPVDGVIGSDSRQAIRAFQSAQGLPVTGSIDTKLLKALGINYQNA